MKKPAVFLAGVGTCALAVASCSTATSPTPSPQSGAPADSAQSAPGAPASSTVDPDTALTSKNGQSGPSAQSGSKNADATVVVIVQLAEGADGEATLASINEAVAASFPGAFVDTPQNPRNSNDLISKVKRHVGELHAKLLSVASIHPVTSIDLVSSHLMKIRSN